MMSSSPSIQISPAARARKIQNDCTWLKWIPLISHPPRCRHTYSRHNRCTRQDRHSVKVQANLQFTVLLATSWRIKYRDFRDGDHDVHPFSWCCQRGLESHPLKHTTNFTWTLTSWLSRLFNWNYIKKKKKKPTVPQEILDKSVWKKQEPNECWQFH